MLRHVSFLFDIIIWISSPTKIQNNKSYHWQYTFFCTEADFVPCFASFSLWLCGVGLHCGRSWISLLAGIIEWAVKMIKDSSNILPLGDKWWVRESEPGRMCEIESTQRQDIFQCQLSLVCIVDCHWLCECKSGQITDADPPERVFFVLFIVIVVQHLNNFNIINSPSFLQWLILFNLINYGTNCTYCLWVFPALCSPLHLTFFFFLFLNQVLTAVLGVCWVRDDSILFFFSFVKKIPTLAS